MKRYFWENPSVLPVSFSPSLWRFLNFFSISKTNVLPFIDVCNEVSNSIPNSRNYTSFHDYIWSRQTKSKSLMDLNANMGLINFDKKYKYIKMPRRQLLYINNAWKLSKYGVFSRPYFPAFGLNTDRYEASIRIQPEFRKIRIRKYSVSGHYSRSVTKAK